MNAGTVSGKWVWYLAAIAGTFIMATLGAFVRQVSPGNEYAIALGRFGIGFVCLAGLRALMASPKLLMLDEPSLGLAPLLVRAIFETVQAINEQGVTVLLVEQNARAALRLADYGYVLETGAISLEGPAQELLHNERVRHAYLGEV